MKKFTISLLLSVLTIIYVNAKIPVSEPLGASETCTKIASSTNENLLFNTAIYMSKICNSFKILAADSISPNNAYTDTTETTISIFGSSFDSQTIVKLKKDNVFISPVSQNFINTGEIQALFNWTDKIPGVYDVLIINPGIDTTILAGGFFLYGITDIIPGRAKTNDIQSTLHVSGYFPHHFLEFQLNGDVIYPSKYIYLTDTAIDVLFDWKKLNAQPGVYNVRIFKNNSKSMIIYSGNFQSAIKASQLPKPIVIQVKDSLGFGISNTQVIFKVLTGNGFVSDTSVYTDANGFVSIKWTLGSILYAQTLSVRTPLIPDFSLTVTANAFNEVFTDPRDGQTYGITEIGSQTWFAQNLNYKTNTLSYCYNDDSLNGKIYGRLYTYDAAINNVYNSNSKEKIISSEAYTQGVCPDGWHLPDSREWDILDSVLGGKDVAGGKLKAVSDLWQSPNYGATNASGFYALPGGGKSGVEPESPNKREKYIKQNTIKIENYFGLGIWGIWWTSDGVTPELYYYDKGIIYDNNNSTYAFSVRCIKN